jgi:hypothetical protein
MSVNFDDDVNAAIASREAEIAFNEKVCEML